jgi:hypothetical protein
MDVFLVPVATDRHELYAENDVEPVTEEASPADRRRSFWQRQVSRFQMMLAEAETERARAERGEASEKGGIGRWVMGKIADAIAEQRLLWQLRHVKAARLAHPADLDGPRAMAVAREQLQADYAKHRRWCVIDAVITCITGPLFFFVPGPNIISWYFVFRAVGHFFALRGAKRGLQEIDWQMQPSADLAAVRAALRMAPPERNEKLRQLAQALGLLRLTAFVNRAAARPS